jgi:hypothetical protein
VLLVTHYVTSVGWLGVGLSQFTLNVVALNTEDAALRHACYTIAHVFDHALLIPLVLSAATTGVLLAWRSAWGVWRHWWIVVKLSLTVGLLVFASVWLGGWVSAAVDATVGAAADPLSASLRTELVSGSVTMVSTLIVTVVISVVKPWGRLRSPSRPALAAFRRVRRCIG